MQCLTLRPSAMPDHLTFGRKLKELLAGETGIEVARKLGYTGGRVSQIMRGERPSREFVERLIEAYALDREEWLAAAGFVTAEAEAERTSYDLKELARLTAEETLRQMELSKLRGLGINTHGMTPEQVQQAIDLWREQDGDGA